jgi:hypothetical protein
MAGKPSAIRGQRHMSKRVEIKSLASGIQVSTTRRRRRAQVAERDAKVCAFIGPWRLQLGRAAVRLARPVRYPVLFYEPIAPGQSRFVVAYRNDVNMNVEHNAARSAARVGSTA